MNYLQHTLINTLLVILITNTAGRAWGTGSVYFNTGCSHGVTGGFPIIAAQVQTPEGTCLVCRSGLLNEALT